MPPELSPKRPPDDHKLALRGQIKENLRRVYNVALEDEVPERFRLLLQQLRDAAATEAAPDAGRNGTAHSATDLSNGTLPQPDRDTGT